MGRRRFGLMRFVAVVGSCGGLCFDWILYIYILQNITRENVKLKSTEKLTSCVEFFINLLDWKVDLTEVFIFSFSFNFR